MAYFSHLTSVTLYLSRCNILKRVPNSALWLLRFPAAGEMRLRACTIFYISALNRTVIIHLQEINNAILLLVWLG